MLIALGCGEPLEAGERRALQDRLDQMQRRLEAMEKHVDELEERREAPPRIGPFPDSVPIAPPRAVADEAHSYTVVVQVESTRASINGRETSDAELPAQLSDALARHPDASLVLHADEGVNHARVVEILDQAKQAGFTKIAIATRAQEPIMDPIEATPER